MKVKFTYKAVEFLRDMLAAPGWAKHDNAAVAVKRNYLAGKIIVERLPEIPDVPAHLVVNRTSTPAELREYEQALKARNTAVGPEFELDDKMVEVIQVAVKHFIQAGNTPSGPALNELIDTFKLLDE